MTLQCRSLKRTCVMKTNLKMAGMGLFFASSLLFSSCVATVRTPVPAARVDVRPAAPSPRHVWVPGHYERRGRRQVWVNGFYTVNRGRGGRYRY